MFSALKRTLRLFKSWQLATIWAAEFIDDRVTTPLHRKYLEDYAHKQMPLKEGIASVTGLSEISVENHLKNAPGFLTAENKNPGMTLKWSSTWELAATTYTLVRILKPMIVVETGVGAGVSSWTILHAMEQNNVGKLVSIDLPTPNTELLPEVGYLVPKNLHHRWELNIGSSGRLLKQILDQLGKIDIFQHDSRHSYRNQLREYLTAWPFISQGGILITDDVNNDALHHASHKWNQDSIIIGQPEKPPIGLVRKTSHN